MYLLTSWSIRFDWVAIGLGIVASLFALWMIFTGPRLLSHLIAKYLFKRKIAWASLLAVMLCTAMVLIVISIMGGWLDMFEKNARGMTGDVVVKGSSLSGFPHYERMIEEIEKLPNIQAAAPKITTFGLVNIGDDRMGSRRTMGVQVMGLPLDRIGKVNEFPKSLYRQYEGWAEALNDPKITKEQRAIAEQKLKTPPSFERHEETTVFVGKLPEEITVVDVKTGRIGPVGDPLFDKIAWYDRAGELALRGQLSDEERQRLTDLAPGKNWRLAVAKLARQSRWPGLIAGSGVLDIRRAQSGKIEGIEAWKYTLWAKLTVVGISEDEKFDQANVRETPYWIVDHSRTKMWQYDQNYLYVPLNELQNDLGMDRRWASQQNGVAATFKTGDTPAGAKPIDFPDLYALFMKEGDERRMVGEAVKLKPREAVGFETTSTGQVVAVRGAQRDTILGGTATSPSTAPTTSTTNPATAAPDAEWTIERGVWFPARVSEIDVKVKPGVPLETARNDVAQAIRRVLAAERGTDAVYGNDPKVKTWEEVNALFLGAIRKEKLLVVVLFAIISVVAVFLIFCIFYMIVAEKTKDIGIIKSVGATGTGVAGIFLGYGLAIGIVGAGFGLLLAYLIVHNINEIHDWLAAKLGMTIWNPETYAFETIPNTMNHTEVIVIIGVAILASVLGALVPALRAARMHPVEALRWE